MRNAPLAVVATMLVGLGAACGPGDPPAIDAGALPLVPAQRAVTIETTGCGLAADRTGSGVAISDGLVLTVAHLVVKADEVVARVGDGDPMSAVVVAVDLNLDLALLRVPPNGVSSVDTSSVGTGSEGFIVGGATSGTVPFVVKQMVSLSIEQILGSDRHSRLGYELEAATANGDSGAGAYDVHDRMIGIVFATSDGGASTWITASAEVEKFLAGHASDSAPMACDPAASRLMLP
ncbi:MAG: trypsin-like peptidase domain-containing protein [Acidimicrobiia bacterium]|nr:trypsin-like peptidase domain-containing protein [Acidimicrobiia bacterium]